MSRRITQEVLDGLKAHEGLRLNAYLCPGDVWTIGYGHTRTAKPGMTISEEEAERLLRADVSHFEEGVEKLLTRSATDNQFSAFVSLAYNIGLGAFKKSTTLRRFNHGDIAGSAEALTWFNKSNGKILNGLVKRREWERGIFLKNVDEDVAVEDEEYTPGNVKGGEPTAMLKDPAVSGLTGASLLAVIHEVGSTVGGLPIPTEYVALAMLLLVGATLFLRWRKQRAGAVH